MITYKYMGGCLSSNLYHIEGAMLLAVIVTPAIFVCMFVSCVGVVVFPCCFVFGVLFRVDCLLRSKISYLSQLRSFSTFRFLGSSRFNVCRMKFQS